MVSDWFRHLGGFGLIRLGLGGFGWVQLVSGGLGFYQERT